jgi:hypothetical protein
MLSTSPMNFARFALALGLVPCLLLTAACADPEGAFDDFVARQTTASSSSSGGTGGGGGGSGCTAPAVGELDGDHILVLSAKLSPKKPIVMSAKVTTADDGGKTAVTMQLQPLDALDRRTPVGAAIDVPVFPIEADGTFVLSVPSADVDGTANPITGNTLKGIAATLTGSGMCSPFAFACGDVTGAIATPPVKLEGSTFTLQPITDPATYPETYINCAQDLANPLN